MPHRIVGSPSGRCPIPLGTGPHALLTDPEILDWFARVRGHGLSLGVFLTRGAIISWLPSELDDPALVPAFRDTLERYAEGDEKALVALDRGQILSLPPPSSDGRHGKRR